LYKAKKGMKDKSEKLKYFELMMWDSSISPEEILAVFEGSKSQVNNFDQSAIFRRVLESFPWFTVLDLFTPGQLKELLSEELISKLRSPALRRQYEFARKRLQKII
jgi:hypothetical protein